MSWRTWVCAGCKEAVDTGDDEYVCRCEAVFCGLCFDKLKEEYNTIDESDREDGEEEEIHLERCWSCDSSVQRRKQLKAWRLSISSLFVDLHEAGREDDAKIVSAALRVATKYEQEENTRLDVVDEVAKEKRRREEKEKTEEEEDDDEGQEPDPKKQKTEDDKE
jgi:hypothetical protein